MPTWARSKQKLSERVEVLEDAAQFLEELDYLTGPVFTDRDLKVPRSDHSPERASELRETATELRRLRLLQPGPELIKINAFPELRFILLYPCPEHSYFLLHRYRIGILEPAL